MNLDKNNINIQIFKLEITFFKLKPTLQSTTILRI
jgi:hypothetical protein